MKYTDFFGELGATAKIKNELQLNHSLEVRRVWKKMRELNYPEGKETTLVSLVEKALVSHDSSIYLGNDYLGYRFWVFPENKKDKSYSKFEKFWVDSQKKNRMSWEPFILFKRNKEERALSLSTVEVVVFLSDMVAMSLKYDINFKDWYKNADLDFTEETVELVEYFLDNFNEVFLLLKEEKEN